MFSLAVVSDEFNPLFDCFLVTDLSNLYKRWTLKVHPCHLFNKRLHSGRKHEERLKVFFPSHHHLLLLLHYIIVISLVQIFGNLSDDSIDRVF